MGTGRCDFPGGSAKELFESITKKIYKLPEETIICVGHNYNILEDGTIKFKTTVKDSLEKNRHINRDTRMDDFIRIRETRDLSLNPPSLLKKAINFNCTGKENKLVLNEL